MSANSNYMSRDLTIRNTSRNIKEDIIKQFNSLSYFRKEERDSIFPYISAVKKLKYNRTSRTFKIGSKI